VVTAGFKSGSLDSLFPAGIPIGIVSNANQNTLINSGQVTVTPSADLRHLPSVQILTAPHAGSVRAQVP
jgi:cell shape-determining protein MreC